MRRRRVDGGHALLPMCAYIRCHDSRARADSHLNALMPRKAFYDAHNRTYTPLPCPPEQAPLPTERRFR
eukprot:1098116-Rhodomonas_salina.1